MEETSGGRAVQKKQTGNEIMGPGDQQNQRCQLVAEGRGQRRAGSGEVTTRHLISSCHTQ